MVQTKLGKSGIFGRFSPYVFSQAQEKAIVDEVFLDQDLSLQPIG
jgi:hypothetical protein